MGGGGNFFSQIGNAISGLVGGGGGGPAAPPAPQEIPERLQNAFMALKSPPPENKGSQQSKPASSAASVSDSQQSVNERAGSGTMLTGNQGVDPQSLELGKKTLLGG